MNGRRSVVLVAATLTIAAGSVAAQQSFREVVKQEGFGWLAGRWTATTSQGYEISLTHRWELDGHMAATELKMGDYAYRGMIFYVSDEERVMEVGVDNRGGRTKGTWEPQGDTMTSTRERVNAEGETQKTVVVYSKVDARTMKVALHGVGEGGDVMGSPWATLDFKRQGRKAGGKQQKGDLGRLQGTWQGKEIGGRGASWTFVISENEVDATAEPESYSGTIKLNAKTDPKQADFVITECTVPRYVNKTSLGIYKLKGKKLTLTACEPGSPMRPRNFEGDDDARVFVLTKQ